MISKRKRNTILAYCMASVIMLLAIVTSVTNSTTQLKSNKKIVAENNYVETNELSYGLVAIEASSALEENKDAKNVTEEKKEEVKESEDSSNKSNTKVTSSDSKSSKKTVTKKTTTTKKKTTTTKKKTTTTKTTKKKTTDTSLTIDPNKSVGSQIATYAQRFIGNPYRMGGTSLTNGADCSGFTQTIFKKFGYSLPRTAAAQSKVGTKVSFSNLKPGDLVFYSRGGKTATHVAIYIGNGKIVHARTPADGIGINSVNIMTKVTARRVVK